MYVESPLDLSSDIRNSLEPNVLETTLKETRNEVSRADSAANNYLRYVEDARNSIQINLIKANVMKQRKLKLEAEVKHLEKALENHCSTSNFEYLNRDSMVMFFEQMGLRFIAFRIEESGDSAELFYMRPAKMIGNLPYMPVIISLYYRRNNGSLVFKSPIMYTPFTTANPLHPHIVDSKVCMGNYFDIVERNGYSLLPDGYQEQVALLENLLGTFNPDSPYRRIEQIIADMATNQVQLRFNDIQVNGEHYHTIHNPAVVDIDRNYYTNFQLLPKSWMQLYYAQLDGITKSDVAQDVIDLLPMDYRSDDSEHENYDHYVNYRKTLNVMFGISLDTVDYYSEFNEENDRDELSEGNYEDMIQSWIDTLKEVVASTDTFSFRMPPLSNAYAEEDDTPSDEIVEESDGDAYSDLGEITEESYDYTPETGWSVAETSTEDEEETSTSNEIPF